MKYNIWFALSYEITEILINDDPRWLNNWIVAKIRVHCKPDWMEWKVQRTMSDVDLQVKELQKKWQEEDYEKYVKPIVIEHKPDNSKAQSLLGGPMSISAPWYKPDEQKKPYKAAYFNPDPQGSDWCEPWYDLTIFRTSMSYTEQLDTIIYCLDELLENPKFLSLLTTEQEIALDQAIDLFNGIADQLNPTVTNVPGLDSRRWLFEQDDEDPDVTIPFSKY